MQSAVAAEQSGIRLASFLRLKVEGLSWSDARKHIVARRVRVNRVVCLDDARVLKAGDVVELLEHSARPLPAPDDVRVVYRDDYLLVVDKPAGMQCERRSEEKHWDDARRGRQVTVVEALERLAGRVYPVHRLDRETSGLMIYALTPEAQQKLIADMSRHAVERVYLAVAIGKVPPGTVRSHFLRDRGDGRRGSGLASASGAQEAITHIAVKELIGEEYSVVECRLETGRTHQIRIHLAEMGHPICGEKLYLAPKPGAAPIVDQSGAERHALHSASLRFEHPITQKGMSLTSDLPADMATLLRRLRGERS